MNNFITNNYKNKNNSFISLLISYQLKNISSDVINYLDVGPNSNHQYFLAIRLHNFLLTKINENPKIEPMELNFIIPEDILQLIKNYKLELNYGMQIDKLLSGKSEIEKLLFFFEIHSYLTNIITQNPSLKNQPIRLYNTLLPFFDEKIHNGMLKFTELATIDHSFYGYHGEYLRSDYNFPKNGDIITMNINDIKCLVSAINVKIFTFDIIIYNKKKDF